MKKKNLNRNKKENKMGKKTIAKMDVQCSSHKGI